MESTFRIANILKARKSSIYGYNRLSSKTAEAMTKQTLPEENY
jgi:hypothetical protein